MGRALGLYFQHRDSPGAQRLPAAQPLQVGDQQAQSQAPSLLCHLDASGLSLATGPLPAGHWGTEVEKDGRQNWRTPLLASWGRVVGEANSSEGPIATPSHTWAAQLGPSR